MATVFNKTKRKRNIKFGILFGLWAVKPVLFFGRSRCSTEYKVHLRVLRPVSASMPVVGVDKTVFGFEAMDYFFVLGQLKVWSITLLGTHVQQLANANILSITWQQIKAIKQGELPKFKLKNGKEGDPSNRESGIFEILRPDRLVRVSQKL